MIPQNPLSDGLTLSYPFFFSTKFLYFGMKHHAVQFLSSFFCATHTRFFNAAAKPEKTPYKGLACRPIFVIFPQAWVWLADLTS